MGFFYSQFLVSLPQPTASFAGKTVIVTGANIGLGKEAARHFTQLGAETVVLAVRSLEKGDAAKRDIEASTGRQGVVRVMHLDMASYKSVLAFADEVTREFARVDVALLNAGIAGAKWNMAEQDETAITVNVVSTFLLALALLPKLEDTAAKFSTRPTLTITASEVHAWAKFLEREAPEGELFARLSTEPAAFDAGERYQVSKLLEVFAVRALAERRSAAELPVTINCVNPGLCHS
jgi:NAD(P)-dependent dehydrogenase (short-subunit alcohol dehydrogenase family)